MIKQCVLAACLGLSGLAPALASEPVDLDMVSRIRQEAFHRSQVMDHFSHLTEVIGPRLTNSPQMAQANAWTRGKFGEWGLANAHDEAFDDFGRGWEFTSASVEMLGERVQPLHALPKAWTPGTDGPVEGELVRVEIKKPADIDKYRGKLAGKILLLGEAREYKRGTEPDSHRHDATSLEGLQEFTVPKGSAGERAKRVKEYTERQELAKAVNTFFAEEGALAAISISGWDNGIIRVAGGGSRKAGEPVGVPELAMIAEHFNPLVRALDNKQSVRLRVNVAARFTDESDRPGYNTLAEIPGSGSKAGEIVMLGAHLDSWHTGTGAADNAAGVAVMMEAMRILKAVGAKPKRTIRVALWSGEEQGLIGSQAYVASHFAHYPEPTDPAQKALPASLREPTGPLRKLRDYDRFSVYFNMDNGSGRFRGIYAQENLAAMPIFEAWLKPFHDVGATTVATRNTGSTDHISFDRVGLPGFQFIQDRLDYFSNVHHSHLDTWDHAEPEDLKQAAAIVASFVYHAAMREEKMPRKPLLAP
ncbi:M20/M25/M40 family metallo-hydrolase [Flavobacterium sp. MXW15]|uniref:Carboxypeptidase Q n=1 Tax=Xanthomonas chitinilytica TaxID=2989819 RepID=A0ABT3JUT3_9XANT|nr:M20/M25/M40 family metallo-hydrolase [Xanthomonas sp. H13-6]MCW4453385.1 M20/M25/M40 family metallo-hydrolase [Flavobacterium sp. MXW15]MCW4472262.1 M20/M25/M40 family metallo-hydrolase [Xanthomonas sp. H13-6]